VEACVNFASANRYGFVPRLDVVKQFANKYGSA